LLHVAAILTITYNAIAPPGIAPEG
jgi:hypothetical protein